MRHKPLPHIIQTWIRQLESDAMLHETVALAERMQENIDVDLSILLRGSNGRAVMEPKITIRR